MKLIRYCLLLLLCLISIEGWLGRSQPVIAADNDFDTMAARLVVKGYLTSLKTAYLSPEQISKIYLTGPMSTDELAQDLFRLPIAKFSILEERWLDDLTYQAVVFIEVSEGKISGEASEDNLEIQVTQETGQWRISDLAWAVSPNEAALSEATPVEGRADSASDTDSGASNRTSDPAKIRATAEVLSYQLNMRAGPGVMYPILDVLDQGDTLNLVGINSTQEWYQISQGDTLGWVSALPDYVAASPDAAELPVVWVPALNSGNNTTTTQTATPTATPMKSSGQGKLVIQLQSGGPFYLVNADGTDLTYISTGIDPALSPDGSQIAFIRWGSGGDGSVWIYDLTTQTERHLLGETREAKSPTWSADGRQLVISFQQGGRPELEINCDTPGSHPPPGAYDINIGSETGRVCYKLPADPHWHLRRIDVETGTFEDLTSATYSYAPTWDPATSWRVLFTDNTGLQALNLNEHRYGAFTSDPRDRGPVFSPDGSQVAVSYKQHTHWEVYTIDVNTGGRVRLTAPADPFEDNPANNASPAWSSDGSQIAFITDRTGQWEVWIMNADGSNQRPLLTPEAAASLAADQQGYQGMDERLISWGP